jgi:hypothetical protein
MGLADHVTARIPEIVLVQLTRSTPTATTIDTAILGYAVADVVGDLSTYAGVVYDDTDARHVAVSVRGVVITLLAYRGESTALDRLDRWRQELADGLRRVTHGQRLLPRSTSPYTPSELPAGATIRPETDPAWLAEILPAAGPGSGWTGPVPRR